MYNSAMAELYNMFVLSVVLFSALFLAGCCCCGTGGVGCMQACGADASLCASHCDSTCGDDATCKEMCNQQCGEEFGRCMEECQ